MISISLNGNITEEYVNTLPQTMDKIRDYIMKFDSKTLLSLYMNDNILIRRSENFLFLDILHNSEKYRPITISWYPNGSPEMSIFHDEKLCIKIGIKWSNSRVFESFYIEERMCSLTEINNLLRVRKFYLLDNL